MTCSTMVCITVLGAMVATVIDSMVVHTMSAQRDLWEMPSIQLDVVHHVSPNEKVMSPELFES